MNFKFSTIAHKNHVFCSPLNSDNLNKLIDILPLDENSKVIDIGCGKGEILLRLIEKFKLKAIGVDLCKEWLEIARENEAKRINSNKLELIELDINNYTYEPNSCDLVICNTAIHSFGTYEKALEELKKFAKPNSLLFIGHPYWKKEPNTEYLEFFGSPLDCYHSHFENVEVAEKDYDLNLLYSFTASDNDWDYYEGLYKFTMEQYIFENPNAPDSEKFKERIRTWHKFYLKYGRDTLGLGFYLFRIN